jgi:hypothetical protein
VVLLEQDPVMSGHVTLRTGSCRQRCPRCP